MPLFLLNEEAIIQGNRISLYVGDDDWEGQQKPGLPWAAKASPVGVGFAEFAYSFKKVTPCN